jgi:hypothetical protein
MATGSTNTYNLPYPLPNDPVNVHEDVRSLAERLEVVLPSLGISYFSRDVRNESGANIFKGDPVYVSGFSSGTDKTLVAKSLASNPATFPVIGIAEENIASGSNGTVVLSGVFSNINTASFSAGDVLYVGTSGGLVTGNPPSGSTAVAVVAKSSVFGIVIVGNIKGNNTWGNLKLGI